MDYDGIGIEHIAGFNSMIVRLKAVRYRQHLAMI